MDPTNVLWERASTVCRPNFRNVASELTFAHAITYIGIELTIFWEGRNTWQTKLSMTNLNIPHNHKQIVRSVQKPLMLQIDLVKLQRELKLIYLDIDIFSLCNPIHLIGSHSFCYICTGFLRDISFLFSMWVIE